DRIQFVSRWNTNNPGDINWRYEPWGGNPQGVNTASRTKTDIKVKDPMVTRSDDWDFPTNAFPHVECLGRIHRGTPWQTLNLKALRLDLATWWRWLGSVAPQDADYMHPIKDRKIVSLLASILSTNDWRQLISANQSDVNDLEAAIDGFVVWTNASALEPKQ